MFLFSSAESLQIYPLFSFWRGKSVTGTFQFHIFMNHDECEITFKIRDSVLPRENEKEKEISSTRFTALSCSLAMWRWFNQNN
jgi:hypothetical protein